MGGTSGAGGVTVLCHAKLNLFLDVVGRRPDGFHDLVTVFHEIELTDTVAVLALRDQPPALTLQVEPASPDVPADATNLACRAAAALWETAGRRVALEVRLRKRIPVGAGLGGGSADAAGALRAANRVLGLRKSADELRAVAATLGSDVAFLVEGGSALARGRGEILERVPSRPIDFLLLVPTFPLATAAVYKALPKDRRRRATPGRRSPRSPRATPRSSGASARTRSSRAPVASIRAWTR
jgi:4-diphosphocytidyl-2-C-methyl-D-erythritol kinase